MPLGKLVRRIHDRLAPQPQQNLAGSGPEPDQKGARADADLELPDQPASAPAGAPGGTQSPSTQPAPQSRGQTDPSRIISERKAS